MQFISKTVLKKFIKSEISLVGMDENYINQAKDKHTFLSIKIFDLTPTQANILKQTALSCNTDCAVHKGVINCSIEKTDCILSGSICQLKNIAQKLALQPFSLKILSENILQHIENELNDNKKTKIAGILNLTTNSFSDGGEFFELDKAINHAIDMIEQGADVLDIGAQATNPKSTLLDIQNETEKIIPVIVALKTAFPHISISVDTFNYSSAEAAINAGADIINDVSSLSNIEFAKLCASNNKKLVIMHSKGNFETMDKMTTYDNLIDDIYKDLYQKANFAIEAGLTKENIIIDLGFGFAKNYEQNYKLLERIYEFKSLGFPMLAGVSRKRFLQDTINTKEPKETDFLTGLATSYLIQNNIDYIRVHNVELSVQARKFQEKLYTLV